MTDDYIALFCSRVNKKSHNECWEWTGNISACGYGRFHMYGTAVRAHRISYELFFGPIPEGLSVLHKCNNQSCVNPYHLYLGTQKENAADMVKSGTHNRLGKSKLNAEERESVKKMLSEGLSQRKIAATFGVSTWLIHSIYKEAA